MRMSVEILLQLSLKYWLLAPQDRNSPVCWTPEPHWFYWWYWGRSGLTALSLWTLWKDSDSRRTNSARQEKLSASMIPAAAAERTWSGRAPLVGHPQSSELLTGGPSTEQGRGRDTETRHQVRVPLPRSRVRWSRGWGCCCTRTRTLSSKVQPISAVLVLEKVKPNGLL